MHHRILPLIAIFCLAGHLAGAKRVVVSLQGNGDFRSIQAAISSVPDSAKDRRIIFIRKGHYREKILLTKSNIILEGEDREGTVISFPVARDEWRCGHADDWGAATMNISASDVTLKNLTIVNSYGFDSLHVRTIACEADSGRGKRILPERSHQMALRTTKATRLKAVNCHFDSWAGDTVSPWNVGEGLFFFKDCIMEGGVDLYCPRGWAYAEGCRFVARRGDAIIWHDGSAVEESKTVLKNCVFEGYDGFRLGRYHRDAQFYLIGCSFAASMADKDIYLVPAGNAIRWGRRIFYAACHRTGGDYPWFADNLNTAPGRPDAKDINARWTFGGKWNNVEN